MRWNSTHRMPPRRPSPTTLARCGSAVRVPLKSAIARVTTGLSHCSGSTFGLRLKNPAGGPCLCGSCPDPPDTRCGSGGSPRSARMRLPRVPAWRPAPLRVPSGGCGPGRAAERDPPTLARVAQPSQARCAGQPAGSSRTPQPPAFRGCQQVTATLRHQPAVAVSAILLNLIRWPGWDR